MNANTLQMLSKMFDKPIFDTLMESLMKVVKRVSSAKWAGILFIRHGEAIMAGNGDA